MFFKHKKKINIEYSFLDIFFLKTNVCKIKSSEFRKCQCCIFSYVLKEIKKIGPHINAYLGKICLYNAVTHRRYGKHNLQIVGSKFRGF